MNVPGDGSTFLAVDAAAEFEVDPDYTKLRSCCQLGLAVLAARCSIPRFSLRYLGKGTTSLTIEQQTVY